MGGSSSWRKGCRLGRRAGGSSRGALGVGWGGEGVFWILDQCGGSQGRRKPKEVLQDTGGDGPLNRG